MTALEIELQPLTPRLTLDVEPADASVALRKLNSRERITHAGDWPRTLDVEAGEWEVTAFRYGYRAVARKVKLKDGEQKVKITLRPEPEDIYWP
jgi:hypothetical protein